jgi:hypothetical protein
MISGTDPASGVDRTVPIAACRVTVAIGLLATENALLTTASPLADLLWKLPVGETSLGCF